MLKVANSVINVSQITGVLPVVNGGTGVTTSTGTGSTVLSAAPTLSGDVTLSTGNLIQGTAAKGINFTSNTPASGMTSELLNWYEEGTWTPACGGVSLTVTAARYTRIGRQVLLSFDVSWPVTVDASTITLGGFPFSSVANSGSLSVGFVTGSYIPIGAPSGGGVIFRNKAGAPSVAMINSDLSNQRVIGSIVYTV